jgi:uncharacterized protein
MRWQDLRRSDNVEDRRGIGGRQIAVGGGLGGLVLGGNSDEVLKTLQTGGISSSAAAGQPLSEKEKELGDFASVILADTEDIWRTLFQQIGRQYRNPKLVLFTNETESGCGFASAVSGPFYCPGDEKVYLDLAFFDEMQEARRPG